MTLDELLDQVFAWATAHRTFYFKTQSFRTLYKLAALRYARRLELFRRSIPEALGLTAASPDDKCRREFQCVLRPLVARPSDEHRTSRTL